MIKWIIWVVWLILVVLWNYGWPGVEPIWDVIVATFLSLGTMFANKKIPQIKEKNNKSDNE